MIEDGFETSEFRYDPIIDCKDAIFESLQDMI